MIGIRPITILSQSDAIAKAISKGAINLTFRPFALTIFLTTIRVLNHMHTVIKGNFEPPGAWIIAVADVYNASMSDRPYRRGVAPAEAREHIVSNAGRHFDS